MKFTKMQAYGNDYICIYDLKIEEKNISDLVMFLSQRHRGIGSDGVILIYPGKKADFEMRIFNMDGTEAKMCGNGIRCVGKFVWDNNLTDKKNITIETKSGIKILKLNVENNVVKSVKVDMGECSFKVQDIPVISKNWDNIKLSNNMVAYCVSVGNPHTVIFVEDVDKVDVKKHGSAVECEKIFPDRTNVEFVQIIDENNIKVRVWERGVGETYACGTGAVAASIVSMRLGKIAQEVQVILKGGKINVKYDISSNHIYMDGEAQTVFTGEVKYV